MVTRHGFPLCVPLDVLLQPIPWSVDWSSRLDFSSCGAQGRNRVEVHLVIFVMRLPHRSLENYTETYVLSSLPILLGNPLHCWLRMLDVDTKISNISYVGCLIVRQLDSWIPNSYIYIYYIYLFCRNPKPFCQPILEVHELPHPKSAQIIPFLHWDHGRLQFTAKSGCMARLDGGDQHEFLWKIGYPLVN